MNYYKVVKVLARQNCSIFIPSSSLLYYHLVFSSIYIILNILAEINDSVSKVCFLNFIADANGGEVYISYLSLNITYRM